jgi:GntR family transcriptional regulator
MKIILEHNSSIPLHVQIEQQLREAIRTPELRNGKKLPNEVDLSKELGVSRNTLRQAINKLVYEGLLNRKKGIGTVVADISINTKANNWLSFSQEMKNMGIEVKEYDLQISWVNPIEELCRFFNIAENSKILKMERLRGNTEHPFVHFISYFNPRIGMTGEEDFSNPLYEILEKEHHTIAKLSKEEISARPADKALAKKLGVNAGVPILVRKRYVFDPGGRPVEWNIGYYRSDSFVYTIESERKI